MAQDRQSTSSVTTPPTSVKEYLASNAPAPIAALVEGAMEGIKSIASAMRSSAALTGYTEHHNVQGETQAELDIFADKEMSAAFFRSGAVAALVSEEQENLTLGGANAAPFVVAHDPLDGSSNIPYNIPVGTIFSAHNRASLSATPTPSDYFKAGKLLACSGYGVYGLKTQFVFSFGAGVIDSVLNERTGEFEIRNKALRYAQNGSIFSVNEGNSASWEPGVQRFVSELKASGSYSGRYVGSLVSDFDRNMRKGGIYLYPADKKNVRGKLRFLYECLPLAFICEQAGGCSFDGRSSVLDLTPSNIHERCPLYLGSKELISALSAVLTQV